MHWMFAQNLEGHAALNNMTVELTSSAEMEERSVKKKKNLCQNNVWTTNVSNRDCVMGEYFSYFYF